MPDIAEFYEYFKEGNSTPGHNSKAYFPNDKTCTFDYLCFNRPITTLEIQEL
jgi:hypothetical protein